MFSPGHLPVHKSTAGIETWTGHGRQSGHRRVSPGQRQGVAPAVDLQKEEKCTEWITDMDFKDALYVKIFTFIVFAATYCLFFISQKKITLCVYGCGF